MTRSSLRWGLGAVFAMLLAVTGAATHPMTGQAKPGFALARGERAEEAGPRFGSVDPRFSTPEAARMTVYREHEHHATGSSSGERSGTSATSAESGIGAVLDPAVFGSWKRTAYNLPMRAIHATLLRNGKVLLISGSGNQQSVFQAGEFTAGLLTPSTGAYKAIDPPYDMFCAGHAQLPNGNVLIVGGTSSMRPRRRIGRASSGSTSST